MKKTVFFVLIALILTGCTPGGRVTSSYVKEENSASRDIYAMDTYMTVSCYGDQCKEALDAAEEEIKRLDALLSVGNKNSEISTLNACGNAVLSRDSSVMIQKALEIYDKTDGCFDITIYPLMVLWGFTSLEYHIPDEDELDKVISHVGSNFISFDASSGNIHLKEGQGIDLGGIAKGYCSDQLIRIFEEYQLDSGLISLGGNVQCYGTKPDGSLWRCGIRNPFDPDNMNHLAGVLEVNDCAVITSGPYERYFTDEDGTIYHHILNPHTGYPADNGLVSVTIVSKSGMLADALSTACFVMGKDKTIEYWRRYGNDFNMILIELNGEITITESLKNSFETDYPMNIISRK